MLARQIDYDALCNDLHQNSGLPLTEACQEAYESFIDGGYDLSNIFPYRSEEDLKLKNTVVDTVASVHKASIGQDSFINANFSFQGLQKAMLMENPGESLYFVILPCLLWPHCWIGVWNLLGSMGLAAMLIKLLDVSVDEDEEQSSNCEEEDEDDTEEDVRLQLEATLNMLLFYLREGHRQGHVMIAWTLSEEQTVLLVRQSDAQVDDKKLTVAFLALLATLLAVPDNVALFHACHGDAMLDLCGKMHKKNVDITAQLAHIASLL